MRAIRIHEFGAPEVMRLEPIADLRPGPAEVLVRIEAAGVNPHDAYVRGGLVPGRALPLTPGQDGAGVVEAVGGAVTTCAAGDRVYVGGSLSGCYATHALCHEKQVHRLPERLCFAEGAAIHVPYATAHRALFQRAAARGRDRAGPWRQRVGRPRRGADRPGRPACACWALAGARPGAGW